MARERRGTVGSKYVAIGALAEVLHAVKDAVDVPDEMSDKQAAFQIAEAIVDRAWDVEHFPVSNRVTITLDLDRLNQPIDPQ